MAPSHPQTSRAPPRPFPRLLADMLMLHTAVHCWLHYHPMLTDHRLPPPTHSCVMMTVPLAFFAQVTPAQFAASVALLQGSFVDTQLLRLALGSSLPFHASSTPPAARVGHQRARQQHGMAAVQRPARRTPADCKPQAAHCAPRIARQAVPSPLFTWSALEWAMHVARKVRSRAAFPLAILAGLHAPGNRQTWRALRSQHWLATSAANPIPPLCR